MEPVPTTGNEQKQLKQRIGVVAVAAVLYRNKLSTFAVDIFNPKFTTCLLSSSVGLLRRRVSTVEATLSLSKLRVKPPFPLLLIYV